MEHPTFVLSSETTGKYLGLCCIDQASHQQQENCCEASQLSSDKEVIPLIRSHWTIRLTKTIKFSEIRNSLSEGVMCRVFHSITPRTITRGQVTGKGWVFFKVSCVLWWREINSQAPPFCSSQDIYYPINQCDSQQGGLCLLHLTEEKAGAQQESVPT